MKENLVLSEFLPANAGIDRFENSQIDLSINQELSNLGKTIFPVTVAAVSIAAAPLESSNLESNWTHLNTASTVFGACAGIYKELKENPSRDNLDQLIINALAGGFLGMSTADLLDGQFTMPEKIELIGSLISGALILGTSNLFSAGRKAKTNISNSFEGAKDWYGGKKTQSLIADLEYHYNKGGLRTKNEALAQAQQFFPRLKFQHNGTQYKLVNKPRSKSILPWKN